MKKTIYILVSFSLHDYEFSTEIFYTLEDARKAQTKWLDRNCQLLGWEEPKKSELYGGTDDRFYYNEDEEYMKINVPDGSDEISTIEIKEITI